MVTDRVEIIKSKIPYWKQKAWAFIRNTTPSHPLQFFIVGNIAISLLWYIAVLPFSPSLFVRTSMGVLNFMFLIFSATILSQHIYKTNKRAAYGFMAALAVLICNCLYWYGYYSPFTTVISMIRGYAINNL